MKLTDLEQVALDLNLTTLAEVFPDYRSRFFEGWNDAATTHVILGMTMLGRAIAEAMMGKTGTLIQAGGCHGLYPIWASMSGAFERVITAEPDPDNLAILEANIEAAPVRGPITVFEGGLYKEPGRCTIAQTPGNPGATCIQQGPWPCIPVTTIDLLVGKFPTNHVSLLVLDVEGAEADVLHGGAQTIQEDRPVILYEHCHDRDARALALLQSWGYETLIETESDRIMRFAGKVSTH